MALRRNRAASAASARILLCLLAGTGLPGLCSGATQQSLEYQVKAAFILNFTRFIEWPAEAFADSAAPFTICIFGKNPFGGALEDVVEGESVGSRKLAIRHISQAPAARECQIVFAGQGEKDLQPLLGSLAPGVLTVGEGDSFLRQGGIIAFVIDNRRVRFDISQSAAERAALRLSSKLLSVARSVAR